MNIKIGKGTLVTSNTDQNIIGTKNFTKKPKINNLDLEFFPPESMVALDRYTGAGAPRISNGNLSGSSASCTVQSIMISPIFIQKPISITGISFRTSGTSFWPSPGGSTTAYPYSIVLYNSNTQDNLPSNLISTLASNQIPTATQQNTWISNTFPSVSLNRGIYWIGFVAGAAANGNSSSIELAGVANSNSLPTFESLILSKITGFGSNQTSQAFGLIVGLGTDYIIPTNLNSYKLDLQFITANTSSFKLRANQPVFWLTYS